MTLIITRLLFHNLNKKMINDKSYIHIGWWMLNELHLKWSELIIYATIFSFTNWTDDHCFHWSAEYLSERAWISRRQTLNSLKRLVEKWLISKKEREINWVKFIDYYATGCPKIRQDDWNNFTGSEKISDRGWKNFTSYNSIYNSINNKSKDLLLLNDKEWEILDFIADTDKKEVKQYWKPEINDLIWAIKEECDKLGVAYVKKKERNFSQLILTSKDYWDLCDKLWMSRKEFALNVLRASVAINYFKWACSWPMRIYENYAEVYNLTRQKSDKNKPVEQNFTSLY